MTTTQAPAGDAIVHIGRVEAGELSEGDAVRAEVDADAREATTRHHTATHLLHAARRAELGPHVHQTGSLVAPDRLRFDFAHGEPLTAEQRRAVQARVNDAVRRNLEVRTDVMPNEAAIRSGAVALFDEKYGDTVRVLTIGDVSKELCGGTHVRHTGEIGEFVLTGEGSVGSGTRRVEALAGAPAEAYLNRQVETLEAVGRALDVSPVEFPRPRGAPAGRAERRPAPARGGRAQGGAGGPERPARPAETVDAPGGGFRLLAARVDPASAPTMERLREAADWLRDKLGGPSVLLLAVVPDGRPLLLVTVGRELTGRGLHAGQLLREVARTIKGGAAGIAPSWRRAAAATPPCWTRGSPRAAAPPGRRPAQGRIGRLDTGPAPPPGAPDRPWPVGARPGARPARAVRHPARPRPRGDQGPRPRSDRVARRRDRRGGGRRAARSVACAGGGGAGPARRRPAAAERALVAAEDLAGVVPRRAVLVAGGGTPAVASGAVRVRRRRPASPVDREDLRQAVEQARAAAWPPRAGSARSSCCAAAPRSGAGDAAPRGARRGAPGGVRGRPGAAGEVLDVEVDAGLAPVAGAQRLLLLAEALDLDLAGTVSLPLALAALAATVPGGAVVVDAGAAATTAVVVFPPAAGCPRRP